MAGLPTRVADVCVSGGLLAADRLFDTSASATIIALATTPLRRLQTADMQ